MSIAGYLEPNKPEASRRKRDEIQESIKDVGPVLSGKESPEGLRQRDSVEAARLGRENGESVPGGLTRSGHQDRFYESVEDYDPVLRSHCRLNGAK